MLNHVKGRHPLVSTCEDGQEQSSKFKTGSMPSYFAPKACDPVRSQKIVGLIAEWVSTDMLPFYVVEGASFHKLKELKCHAIKL